jgi:hypothetical protein
MKEFKSGNIAPNPSFEEGSPLSSDTTIFQSIKKWEIIGENVQYLELKDDSLLTQNGKRVVYICKTKSSETDSLGDGIISDYIKVIPGNYDLSLYVKAQNISPQSSKPGSKINDAINIRLLFYDDQRKPISPEVHYPYFDTQLDNSCKSFSFANFHYLDSLNWSKIIGRTYNYPFSEGDIPDNCRYVKIFIGLKGTGKLWIDNINLSYSKWNFTPQERISKYHDSIFPAVQMLIPTPQYVKFKRNIPLITAGNDKVLYPGILLKTENTTLSKHSADFLALQLKNTLLPSYPDCQIQISFNEDDDFMANSSVVFLLSDYKKTDTTKHSELLPGFSTKNQGYFISDTMIARKPIIIVAAHDHQGLYYATTTISRLLDKQRGLYTHAQVIDYPAFQGRGFQISPSDSSSLPDLHNTTLDFLTYYRFNKAYLPYYQNDEAKEWHQNTEKLTQYAVQTGNYIKEKATLSMGVMFNPYYHLDYEMHTDSMTDSLKNIWIHDEKGIQMIIKTLKPAFDNGAQFLMLLGDDFVPHSSNYRKLYDLWSESDIKRHINLQTAQAFVINELHKWLNTNYGKIRFEFCPPWYLNEFIDRSRGRAEAYFRDLDRMIPEDIVYVWTGNTVRSLSFDKADIKRFSDITGRQLMLWDNTLYARSLESSYGGYPALYPGKTKLCNIFEPYDVIMPSDFHFTSPHFYANGLPYSEIYKIKFATLSDFLWNPTAYNPDLSLWKVLINLYGKTATVHLIEINDMYFRVLSNIILLERDNRVNKSLHKNTGHALQRLITQIEELSKTITNSTLAEELGEMTNTLQIRFDNLNKETNNEADSLVTAE